jgi:hypothetical protein
MHFPYIWGSANNSTKVIVNTLHFKATEGRTIAHSDALFFTLKHLNQLPLSL